MKKIQGIIAGLLMFCICTGPAMSQSLWNTAKENKDVFTVSTLFIAQDVRDFLSTPDGLDNAVSWCKQTGITRVFIETYRDSYYAEREALVNAKNRFLKEGFGVSGCVTTVGPGKNGVGGWGITPCYTNQATLEEIQKIFEYTASIFDVIMIDDFLFTDCECEDCFTARGDQSWSKFRCDLMVDVSRERILKPAKAINPNARIIIKYPLWYDNFHNSGYEVVRETRDYDYIWVGTETRDYDYKVRPGGEVQYNAFFIMQWLGSIGGDKTGGGWVDALGTTPKTYLEQARQTILGSAKEIMLFHYGNLLEESNFYDGKPGTGVADVEAFRIELPGLLKLARIIHAKPIRGIHMPKPPSSDSMMEPYVFSFIGMLGLPLVPAHAINDQAKTAILSVHAVKEPGLSAKLRSMLSQGSPVMITDGLAPLLSDQTLLKNPNLSVLKVGSNPKSLLDLTREELKPIRDKMLAPLGMKFDAPNKVGLYLYGDNCFVVENFNDNPVDITLELPRVTGIEKALVLPEEGKAESSLSGNRVSIRDITPRTLVVLEYR